MPESPLHFVAFCCLHYDTRSIGTFGERTAVMFPRVSAFSALLKVFSLCHRGDRKPKSLADWSARLFGCYLLLFTVYL